MGVTTMPSMLWLINHLQKDYPKITFENTGKFAWSPSSNTVQFKPSEPGAEQLLLHELAHAILDHRSYDKDIQLLAIETAAWERAKEIATSYGIQINNEVAESHLDSYRDWMHARSLCPDCGAVGFQHQAFGYTCPACGSKWRVNEARLCGLKRYRTT